MVRSLSERGAQLTLSAPDEDPVTPSPRVVENIDQVVTKAARVTTEYATIEGKLELISTHNVDSFAVWESLGNTRIECRVSNPEQLELAKALLRRRVAVSGLARYRNGKPTYIQVENVRLLREASELPQPDHIGKIDITSGLDAEDYIRRMRDAQ
jgi:hypothetical protein